MVRGFEHVTRRTAVLHLLVVYLHLLATCAALGAIMASDLRLLGKAWSSRARLVPPDPFVARLVGVSLVVLCVSGAALLGLGLQANPDYLRNEKVQAKLVLVALLAVNAVVLHGLTFPRLATGRPLRLAGVADALVVAVPVALSNGLWFFCAFLGVARRWNNVMPFGQVLAIAAAVVGVTLVAVVVMLALTERRAPGRRPGTAPVRGAASAEAHLVPKMRSPASPRPGTM
jgi:hypothetical protein